MLRQRPYGLVGGHVRRPHLAQEEVDMPSLRLPPAGGGLDELDGESLLESAMATSGTVLPTGAFHEWFADRGRAGSFEIVRTDFAALDDWYFDERTGDLRHRSGRFFTMPGLEVNTDRGAAPTWSQPIINQPEIGILGILVKPINGVLHCLMQAKMEPGNVNTLQLSPTVQATQSNYTRVHKGGSTPYLEYFAGPGRGRLLVDTLQSEQGRFFYQKRNRNLLVEVTEDVPDHPDFCWLTLGQLRRLLAVDNLVNMPARTVLSCIPFIGPRLTRTDGGADDGGFAAAVADSLAGKLGSVHTMFEILSWLTEAKTRCHLSTQRIPLNAVPGWHRTDSQIVRDDEGFFRVIAVSVDANTREVHRWTQPMVEPVERGLMAFVTKRIDGAVHVLAQARLEPGYLDGIELGPTVQYLPGIDARPLYLDDVLGAPAQRIRFDRIQSEEGGRLYHAQNRYVIVEAGPGFDQNVPDDYCWIAADQIVTLLGQGRYLNIEARTLVACLNSLW
jgi:dTDP-4-dehydro-6-deoxy-alpha-D-glucopyranose 2,3-dehydratase